VGAAFQPRLTKPDELTSSRLESRSHIFSSFPFCSICIFLILKKPAGPESPAGPVGGGDKSRPVLSDESTGHGFVGSSGQKISRRVALGLPPLATMKAFASVWAWANLVWSMMQ
jgi:hypothetical protein